MTFLGAAPRRRLAFHPPPALRPRPPPPRHRLPEVTTTWLRRLGCSSGCSCSGRHGECRGSRTPALAGASRKTNSAQTTSGRPRGLRGGPARLQPSRGARWLRWAGCGSLCLPSLALPEKLTASLPHPAIRSEGSCGCMSRYWAPHAAAKRFIARAAGTSAGAVPREMR
ncbi:hypothetical protein P7K49_036037 [Saguinus oedipus]|uniref:Uncharacterized protein n=1 Tax=Saguinus oedipus TaxID=9490 RepID=A0ABQ9TPB6_SAGOE|nr:hypothetical protein P7K49_036037 [Saguinus oedipus]